MTDRFALASLTFFDMRALLRDLAAGAATTAEDERSDEAEGAMAPKPHRVLLDRVSGYADEAAAYMRRRRVSRRPFARLYYAGGRAEDHATDSADRRRALRRRRQADRGRREETEVMSGPEELLDPAVAERVIARALAHGGEFAEVFAERRSGPDPGDRRVADRVRAVRAPKRAQGCAWSATARPTSPTSTASTPPSSSGPPARQRRRCAASEPSRGALRAEAPTPQPIEQPPGDVPAARKAELLRELDERARSAGAEIAQASASYGEARREVAVANSTGLFSGDDRTRVRIGAQVVARREGRVETGAETLGGHRGFELFDGDPAEIAESAARKALTLLDAGPAPTGSMPVVVGGGFGGVLFHEMTGHGLEADHVQKGASVYAGKLGEAVAQPLLTAYDDGRMPGEWGSDAIDDEGAPTQTDAGDRGRSPGQLPL